MSTGVNQPNASEWALYCNHTRIGAWVWYGSSRVDSQWSRSRGSSIRYATEAAARQSGEKMISAGTIKEYEVAEITNPRTSRVPR